MRDQNLNENKKILIIAHRGASKLAPENTLKAFQTAIDLGADYIEFDVRKSKDGEIVIMHDRSVFRTTHKLGWINRMTLEEIKSLDAGEGEEVPTLKELIKNTKGKIKYMCEIKTYGIIEKVIRIFDDFKLQDDTILISFKHTELVKVQNLNLNLRTGAILPSGIGWLTNWFLKKKSILSINENIFYSINPYYKLLNQNYVNIVHKKGLKIFPWTINSNRKMKKLFKMNIDGILTNDILKAKKSLESYQEE